VVLPRLVSVRGGPKLLTEPVVENTVRKGSYIRVLRIPEVRRIRVGRLGVFEFPSGFYLYFGSALNGLCARIARHRRREKKLHWHIDFLTQVAEPKIVWVVEDSRRLECEWSRKAAGLPQVDVPVGRFGSSDCRCATHLVRV